MGFLDKIKDLFVDEVIEEDEVDLEEENKEVYEEPKNVLPKVMRDNIAKDEVKEEPIEEKESKKFNMADLDQFMGKYKSPKKEEEVVVPKKEEQPKFTFPIDLEEDYVPPKRTSNINILDIEKVKAKEKPVEEKDTKVLYPEKEIVKPKFKASPVISPVYGILDKNYTKEEVKEKEENNDSMKRPSKKVDFESVRKKAFGNLTDELKDNLLCENCELYKEVKRISSLKEDDLLYDMTVDDTTPVTIEKAYDNYEEFGVAYQPEEKPKKKEIKEEVIINNNEDVAVPSKIEIKEPVEEVPSREEKNKQISEPAEDKVDADFFELIDSMYKERSEE